MGTLRKDERRASYQNAVVLFWNIERQSISEKQQY
jgi:hypothetical protein